MGEIVFYGIICDDYKVLIEMILMIWNVFCICDVECELYYGMKEFYIYFVGCILEYV